MANQSHRRSSAEGVPYRSKLTRIESSVGKSTNPRNHIDVFRRGPAAWNRWRNKNPSTIPDLNGLVLGPGEREMGSKSGGPINLSSALLRGASLRSVRLLAADLERADLTGADLSHGRLNQANLNAANLSAARLNHADLTGATLRKTNLKGARLRSANLTDADLTGAYLTDADLHHARLQGANLSAANLSQARCDYADFADAKLKGANLIGASLYHAKNLTRAQIEAAKWDGSTILPPHLAGAIAGSPVRSPAREKPKDTGDKARAKKKAPMRAAPPRAEISPARTSASSSLRNLGRRVSWIVAAALWTFVVIFFAMKHSSEAVPLLPPAIPAVPELGLSATGPSAAAYALPTSEATRGARGVENAAASPIVFVALRRPHDATNPAPAFLDEPSDRAPIAPGLHALPLRQIGPDTAEDIRPDTVRAVVSAPRNVRLASLKQASLRPVTKTETLRLRDAPADTPLAEEPATGPVTLIVSLRHQKLDIYRGTRLIETTAISSGMEGHETKAGVFSILEKRRYHRSNIYSNAPMPWMQRLTRSGTALHGGDVPGYPASHGCIRLPIAFAPRLFEMTERGMNVVVADDQIAPSRIDHPNLPQPATDVAGVSRVQASLEAGDGAIVTDASSAPPLRILVTRRTLRDRIISVQQALSEMGYLARQNLTGIVGPQTRAALKAFQKANDLPQTGTLSKDLAAAIYQAAGKEEPPQGHLFVRQGYSRLFDEPVAFSDPDRSLGTHVFTSMIPAPGESEITWLGMSLEDGDAANALDRLHIPGDLRQKLAEAMTPGSTFIIGDISLDTAILPDGDDFIVVTKDAPTLVAAIPTETKQAARKTTVSKQAKRTTPRRVTREARRRLDSGPRNFPRGLFSRW